MVRSNEEIGRSDLCVPRKVIAHGLGGDQAMSNATFLRSLGAIGMSDGSMYSNEGKTVLGLAEGPNERDRNFDFPGCSFEFASQLACLSRNKPVLAGAAAH